ncbi:MAG: protein-L-isoaspartate(D-aspartate) O-methyltransferase [Vicinamibacterales bacterium]|nr:protein-L-isoaspartate(D-aspartate) O-methyltransferase [Vicinamibacterales bacterium]
MAVPSSPPCGTRAPDPWRAARLSMVETQVVSRGVGATRVLDAMRDVPRHLFVPEAQSHHAYGDYPVPIGRDQTISQPYIVALMTELARPVSTDRALEVGTGSGYQAAVLARLVGELVSVERELVLANRARQCLSDLDCANVTVIVADGYAGYPARAPYDVIVVTAAPDTVPAALLEQLAPGGRLVIPVGPTHDVQELMLVEQQAGGTTTTTAIIPVRFVPMRRGIA